MKPPTPALTLAGTGHRPSRLGGYGSDVGDKLQELAKSELINLRPEMVISGMALGWDTALAQAALELSVPFVAAVPFEGYADAWPAHSRKVFDMLLTHAARVVYVSPPAYSVDKLQKRNEWMIDHCDGVLALWDGTPSGTGNCVRYARRQRKPVINCWPAWAIVSGEAYDY